MANHRNRFQSLSEYEQLKRKNRRRLVGASVLVICAGFLLAKVLNQSSDNTAAETISIRKADGSVQTASSPETQHITITNHAASADDASDLSPAAVLEPAPEDTQTIELDNPLLHPAPAPESSKPETVSALETQPVSPDTTASHNQDSTTEAIKPIPNAASATPETKPTETKTAVKKADTPQPEETAPPPVVVINNKVEPESEAERKAAAQKAQREKAENERLKQQAIQRQQAEKQKAEAEKERQATEAKKQAEQRQAEQKAQRLKAQKQAQEKAAAQKRAAEAARKKQEAANRKAAEDALNNKSADIADKVDPQAILEAKASAKASIQLGAFSSRQQARQMQQKLADKGISSYITEADTGKGKTFRVRTGSYPTREAAGKALDSIHKKGFDGIIIGQS
ncbi:SPOR domain-containing protein [Neisseria montereyensis]|uniref:SPOR domain-containing protein n=1 Tax=Neisseria montereyensis TaxID=2973938 RepID=A0ABT2FAM0_9NEIS|nr:SPOR domain-containing protein [Neisseria montereyensis]MCS4532996.1 SPOR domain-containing protein [Neisseria montereyensis]